MNGYRNSSGKTIENICNWFLLYLLPVVRDACGIKRSQNAYVRKLTF